MPSKFFFFFSLFLSAVEETFDLSPRQQRQEKKWNCSRPRPPPDEYFASELNVINNVVQVPGQRDEGGAER